MHDGTSQRPIFQIDVRAPSRGGNALHPVVPASVAVQSRHELLDALREAGACCAYALGYGEELIERRGFGEIVMDRRVVLPGGEAVVIRLSARLEGGAA